MNCNSCKEPINLKLRHALAQNVCPFCGDGILSKADFVFRKSIAGILKNHGITDGQKAYDIISDIEGLVNGDVVVETQSNQTESTSPNTPEPLTLDGVVIEGDEEPDVTDEEKAVVKKMIDSGELVMSNTMTKDNRQMGAKLKKPIPMPIKRSS